MAGAALPGRLTWQLGRVADVVEETARAKSLILDMPAWPGHRAGQHVDVRLTAEDGYQTQRSYSIASGPEDGFLVLTVERLEDGEVSPYLVDVLRPGDELELRGPIGGYFVWEASLPAPLLLVAGGSGIVPFRAILRHWAAADRPVEIRVVYSARSTDEVIYRQELMGFAAFDEADVQIVLTREWPQDWAGHRGRLDRGLLGEIAWPPEDGPRTYICGPSGFVETASSALIENGHSPSSIRTERFGPTGS